MPMSAEAGHGGGMACGGTRHGMQGCGSQTQPSTQFLKDKSIDLILQHLVPLGNRP